MPGAGDPIRMRVLLKSQRRAAIVPALRGFLSTPLATDRLHEIVAPTLVLTHSGDRLHPLRSGEILHDLLPHADLNVAPSATYWQDHPDELVNLLSAFLTGRDARNDRSLASASSA